MISSLLQCSPLVSKIDNDAFQIMLLKMKREKWPRDYFLTTQSFLTQRFFILLKGRIKIVQHHFNNGRELTLFLLGPGDGFNIMSLINSGGRNYQLTTLDEVEILSASVDQWLEWIDRYPSVRKSVKEYSASQMQRLGELASELALDDTMTRLIHLLLRYYNDPCKPKVCNLIKNLSQEELAQLVGTVRPVVARLLGELRRSGLIQIANGELRIIDKQGLLLVANKSQESLTV